VLGPGGVGRNSLRLGGREHGRWLRLIALTCWV
jgi:hypothetical protein